MKGQNEYGQDVYRRLELVRKQFQTQAGVQKKVQARERRQALREFICRNGTLIGRIVLYIVSGLLVAAAFIMLILEKI